MVSVKHLMVSLKKFQFKYECVKEFDLCINQPKNGVAMFNEGTPFGEIQTGAQSKGGGVCVCVCESQRDKELLDSTNESLHTFGFLFHYLVPDRKSNASERISVQEKNG